MKNIKLKKLLLLSPILRTSLFMSALMLLSFTYHMTEVIARGDKVESSVYNQSAAKSFTDEKNAFIDITENKLKDLKDQLTKLEDRIKNKTKNTEGSSEMMSKSLKDIERRIDQVEKKNDDLEKAQKNNWSKLRQDIQDEIMQIEEMIKSQQVSTPTTTTTSTF